MRFKKWMLIFKLQCEINYLILEQSKSSKNTVLLSLCKIVLSSGHECASHYQTKILILLLLVGDFVLLQFYFLMQ